MSTAVYSAITGGYDTISPHPHIPGVDFIVFTDDPDLVCPGWERVLLEPSDASPRTRAKYPKILAPQRELAGYQYTIWVDGNEEITTPSFVDEALANLGPDGFALHKHPGRDCIYQEVEASLTVPLKYDDQPVVAQGEHYRSLGHPEHWGLWACGSMARERSDRLDEVMADWMAEIEKWTIQDQISLPVVLRKHGVVPYNFPHRQYESPWLRIYNHDRQD